MKRRKRNKFPRILIIIAVFTVLVFAGSKAQRTQYTDNCAVLSKPQPTVGITTTGKSVADTSSESKQTSDEQPDHETEELKSKIKELSALYKEIYIKSEKQPSQYFNDKEKHIPQSTIDEIEMLLIHSGYTVMNSDAVYPEYIENSDCFYSFWDKVKLGQSADVHFWGIAENGGLYYRRLRYHDGSASCLNLSTKWSDAGDLEISSSEQRAVLNWQMTSSGDIIYQDMIIDRHWTASKLSRLKPVDRKLYDLNRRYIEPIGYHNVNIFLTDWDSENFGELCFNDLLSGLYYADFAVRLDTMAYPLSSETGYNAIPSETFEKAILHHFDISQSKLRRLAHYDAESDAYPYNSYVISYDSYYPTVIADVTACEELGDGIIRLTVNLICPDLHCGSVLVHELTVRREKGGDYKYLSNRVVFREAVEQPSSKPGVY